MPKTRRKPTPSGKIEKPEDKFWKEEFDAMGVEEHEKALHQLGLDDEDIEEWEDAVGLKGTKPKTPEKAETPEKGEKKKR